MRKFNREIKIGKTSIKREGDAYFIADIGANHNGDIEKAKELIYLAAEAGAHAAKFQHFKAETIVSKKGFDQLGNKKGHQSGWKKSVFDVYKDASIDLSWTEVLVETCEKAGIAFFTSPYSVDLVDYIDPYVPAYKIGSGDITWPEIIQKISSNKKPVLLACGASKMDEVAKAVDTIGALNSDLVLMQCNTNYTASPENFKYINLNVLKTFRSMYPDVILGLSDHTPGHSTVLGALALGANVIEKHFTDSNDNEGPDHKFAMNPKSWREMVDRSLELTFALGEGVKKIEENELETVILQRRAIRASLSLSKGHVITESDLKCLRPCPSDSISPNNLESIIGRAVRSDIQEGEVIKWTDIE